MFAALDRNEFDVVITFATNRLARKVYRALQFVEEQIVEKRRRCVFVAQRIDTENKELWKALLYVHAMLDEVQVSNSTAHIQAAHEGLLLQGFVHGTVTFGYEGVPIDGPLTRLGRPRRKTTIEPVAAGWVKQIFAWYINDQLDYHEIARRLRKASAPHPPKVSRWTWLAVRHVLKNPRYTGAWDYGVTETVWQSAADYGRQFKRQEPRLRRHDEALRIIDDETFLTAQKLILERGRRSGGRKRCRGDGSTVIDPVKNLLLCPTHEEYLKPVGPNGDQLVCRSCKKDSLDGVDGQTGPLFSSANRRLVLEMLCDSISKYIVGDEAFVQKVTDFARQQIAKAQKPDPVRLDQLRGEADRLSRDIQFILNNLGESDADRKESERRLAQLRTERASKHLEMETQAKLLANHKCVVPDSEAIRQKVMELSKILREAAQGDPTSAALSRKIFKAVTGGKILVSQQGEPRAQKGWLRGTFDLHLIRTIVDECGVLISGDDCKSLTVTIDFQQPSALKARFELVKELMDGGLMMSQIGERLGISRAQVTAAKIYWFESRGLPIPDGRGRRSTLKQQHNIPPLYQAIAGQVIEHFNAGKIYTEIATLMRVDKNTITSSIKWWHLIHNLPVPDGRPRRKTLEIKSRASLSKPAPNVQSNAVNGRSSNSL